MTSPVAERERLRSAVARILDVFVSREGTPEQFAGWAATAETFAASIEQDPPNSLFWGLGSKGILAVQGILTPAGFVPKPSAANDSVTGTVVFGADQEGHRGVAHGGTVAHAFDVIFGVFHTFLPGPQYTRELTIRYLKPVPLEREISLSAHVERVEGRNWHMRAQAVHEGVTLAEASAIMVLGPKA